MYTIEDLKASLQHEANVVRHLFAKIPKGKMHYKPTDKQRTTLELLQYISIVIPASVSMVFTGDSKVFMDHEKKGKETTAENFLEVFNHGEKEAMKTLEKFDAKTLKEEINLFGMGQMSKGVYLVNTINKWIVAYKMQLFLYIKASGNTDIGTSNLWGGFDMQPK